MIAYKFLAAGAVGPFTGFRWPVPADGAPGAWVSAPPGPAGHGVHACRPAHLPYWLQAELWRAELAEPVREALCQVIAPRGRLLGRVEGWDAGAARALSERCAWRTRDRAAGALRRAGLAAEAERLLACRELEALRATGAALAPHGGLPARLGGYLGDAVAIAGLGAAGGATYVAAHVAQLCEGNSAAAGEERAWQARWMAEQLALD